MRCSVLLAVALMLLVWAPMSQAGETIPIAENGAHRLAVAARASKLPPRAQQSIVRKVQSCPRGQGSCSNGFQTWCCPTYPNFPNCSCGNYPGSCSGRCY
jgi:hypothetical protein